MTRQANIIGELRASVNELEIKTNEKDADTERITQMNNELVDTLVSRDYTIKDLEGRLLQFLDVRIVEEPINYGSENQVAESAFDGVQENAGAGAAHLAEQGEEITTLRDSKNSGYTRAGPQNGARPKTCFSSKEQHTQKLNCTECPETRTTEAPMAAHMSCHREPGMHVCDDCSYKSNEKNHLRNHLKHTRHTGTFREYICHECRLEFQSENEEKNHMETHEPDGAKSAPAGQMELHFNFQSVDTLEKTKSNIEKHMECHDQDEEDSTFLCPDCSFQSMNRDQLLVHLEIKHDKHICNNCNIACKSRNDSNKHIAESHRSHKLIHVNIRNADLDI